MNKNWKPGNLAYIVENKLRVREVKIVKSVGGRYLVSWGYGEGMTIPGSRLYETWEAAESTLPVKTPEPTRESYHQDWNGQLL